MFELIVNILLALFLGVTFFTNVLEAAVPAKVANNPYALQPDIWPKVIIVLLLICIVANIVRIIKANKGKESFTMQAFLKTIPNFFKSKVFLGILILAVASLILEALGFMVTCFLILFVYGILLGERNYVRLLITSVIITFALYIVFSVLLSVNLPRGTVGFLRSFALLLESLFR